IARYGFRFSKDPDGRNGLLLVVNAPEKKDAANTTFHLKDTFGWRDTDGDVGGRGLINNKPPSGRTITRTDNEAEGTGLNGYDQAVVTDGKTIDGTEVLWSRIDPADATVVEFAFDYQAFGLSQADMQAMLYWDFEAVQGGPKEPSMYRWNDALTNKE